MKVQKQHLRIAVYVLIVAVVIALWSAFKPGVRAPTAGTPRDQAMLAPEQAPAGRAGGQVDPQSIPAPPDIDMLRIPGWSRDPFLFGNESRDIRRAVLEQQPRGSDPHVRSILFGPDRRVALVEDRMVTVGDSIGSFRVSSIERTAVVFTAPDGERRRVSLYGPAPTGLRR